MYQVKKRLLIICSIIGVLLVGFQFPIYAETTPPDYSSSTSIMSSTPLDQYFYNNYDLLPYLEANNDQYINTNINGKSDLLINISFSNLTGNGYLFDSRVNDSINDLGIYYNVNLNYRNFYFNNNSYRTSSSLSDYNIYNFKFDKNLVYFNGSLLRELTSSEFNNNLPLYIFGSNHNGTADYFGKFKLYKFSIYDYSANDGEGALVRDYYPARSKSSGIIGLYDAVSKTFVTTSGSVPFDSPDGDPVNLSLGANITQFLSASLSWIGAIFEGINDMPIIWVFIAIALAGVIFRWARRIVHF